MMFWRKRATIDLDRPVDCKGAARVLQDYLDGELDDASRSRVHDHLEVCRECGLEADTYRAIKEAIGSNRAPSDEAVRRLERFADDLMKGGGSPS